MEKTEKYVKMALEMGAEDSKVISVEDLMFDPRTLLKCMYGCDEWGKNWTCPSAPKALRPWEAEKILKPSMQALGIDVYSTVKKQGLPIEPLKTKGDKNNIDLKRQLYVRDFLAKNLFS